MIKVWILVLFIGNYNIQGGPTVVDNLASLSECDRVGKLAINIMNYTGNSSTYRCIEAWKIQTK